MKMLAGNYWKSVPGIDWALFILVTKGSKVMSDKWSFGTAEFLHRKQLQHTHTYTVLSNIRGTIQ